MYGTSGSTSSAFPTSRQPQPTDTFKDRKPIRNESGTIVAYEKPIPGLSTANIGPLVIANLLVAASAFPDDPFLQPMPTGPLPPRRKSAMAVVQKNESKEKTSAAKATSSRASATATHSKATSGTVVPTVKSSKRHAPQAVKNVTTRSDSAAATTTESAASPPTDPAATGNVKSHHEGAVKTAVSDAACDSAIKAKQGDAGNGGATPTAADVTALDSMTSASKEAARTLSSSPPSKSGEEPNIQCRPRTVTDISTAGMTGSASPRSDKENKSPRIILTWKNKERDAEAAKAVAGTKRSADVADLKDHQTSQTNSSVGPRDPKKLTLKLKFWNETAAPKTEGVNDAASKLSSAEKPATNTREIDETTAEDAPRHKKRRTPDLSSGSNVTPDGDIEMKDVDGDDAAIGKDAATNVHLSVSDEQETILVHSEMKRFRKILNKNDPNDKALIEAAEKAPRTIYDTDGELEDGEIGHNIAQPDKFLNVKWGEDAYIKDDSDFEENLPFSQFVPGRFERMPDGTARDQKWKLLVKLVTKDGQKKIFRNHPPKDWEDQEAISALNKRTVQQIRRNTKYRSRPVVHRYIHEEREWILQNLNKQGKPKKDWKLFISEFNKMFAGKTFGDDPEPRPARTGSSLTKEVERFREIYTKGQVPVPVEKPKKRTSRKKLSNVETASGDQNATAATAPTNLQVDARSTSLEIAQFDAGSTPSHFTNVDVESTTAPVPQIDAGFAATKALQIDEGVTTAQVSGFKDAGTQISSSPKKRKSANAESDSDGDSIFASASMKRKVSHDEEELDTGRPIASPSKKQKVI